MLNVIVDQLRSLTDLHFVHQSIKGSCHNGIFLTKIFAINNPLRWHLVSWLQQVSATPTTNEAHRRLSLSNEIEKAHTVIIGEFSQPLY